MLSVTQARETALSLVERATAAGADASDAIYIGDRSSGVQVRLGELEDVQRSEGRRSGCAVRGTRSASVSSSDLSADALSRWSTEHGDGGRSAGDQYSGLAPAEL